jgi:hypothetical protein
LAEPCPNLEFKHSSLPSLHFLSRKLLKHVFRGRCTLREVRKQGLKAPLDGERQATRQKEDIDWVRRLALMMTQNPQPTRVSYSYMITLGDPLLLLDPGIQSWGRWHFVLPLERFPHPCHWYSLHLVSFREAGPTNHKISRELVSPGNHCCPPHLQSDGNLVIAPRTTGKSR